MSWRVSTSSADGTDNLAPHSFFTIASVTPPEHYEAAVERAHRDSETGSHTNPPQNQNHSPEGAEQ